MSARRWFLVSAVVAAMTVVSCGVPRDDVEIVDSDELPAALRASSTTTSSADPTDQAEDGGGVAVYWIRDKLLEPERITFETAPDVERLISLLERGPNITSSSPEVRSAVSQADVVRDVSLQDATAIVELSGDFSEVAGSDQVLALGQIVATATSVPGVSDVQFERSGESLDVPVPDGSLVQRPVRRSDYSSLLSEVPSNR